MTYQTYFKRNKFGSTKTIFNGRKYDSKFEASVAEELELRKKAKDIKDYECQVKIDLRAYGKHICNYFIDFVITHNDGGKEYLEVKGFRTEVWRLKWKLFEAQMNETEPDAILTIYEQKQSRNKGWRGVK